VNKQFYVVNIETGDKWEPDLSRYTESYVVMGDDNIFYEVTFDDTYHYVYPLDRNIWAVFKLEVGG
jgi:hypothetical protein